MFRRNVAVVIFNEDSQVLACYRKDRKGWQCVQGGIDGDEDVIAAAWREIEEEIGLTADHGVQFVCTVQPPHGDATKLRYLLPKFASPKLRAEGYIGQQQEIVLFFAPRIAAESVRLIPSQEDCIARGIKQEFRRVEWMTWEDFLPKTGDIRRHIFSYMAIATPPLMTVFLSGKDTALLLTEVAQTQCLAAPLAELSSQNQPLLPVTVAPREPQLCFKCNEPGHVARHCNRSRLCFKCSEPGHMARDCPHQGSDSKRSRES